MFFFVIDRIQQEPLLNPIKFNLTVKHHIATDIRLLFVGACERGLTHHFYLLGKNREVSLVLILVYLTDGLLQLPGAAQDVHGSAEKVADKHRILVLDCLPLPLVVTQ